MLEVRACLSTKLEDFHLIVDDHSWWGVFGQEDSIGLLLYVEFALELRPHSA
jgi:hypothetical protein